MAGEGQGDPCWRRMIIGFYSISTLPSYLMPNLSSNSNEEVPFFPLSSKFGASPSNGQLSYPGHRLRVSYPSAEMQSANSTASVN